MRQHRRTERGFFLDEEESVREILISILHYTCEVATEGIGICFMYLVSQK